MGIPTQKIVIGKDLSQISVIKSRFLESTVILLRRTTRKIEKGERLIINYLKTWLQQGGYSQSPKKKRLPHFELQDLHHWRLMEALERLKKRNIIRIVLIFFLGLLNYNGTIQWRVISGDQ